MKHRCFIGFVAAIAAVTALALTGARAHAQQTASGNTDVVVSNHTGNGVVGGGVSGTTNSSYVVADPHNAQGSSASAATGVMNEKTGTDSATVSSKTVTSTLATGAGAKNDLKLATTGLQWSQTNNIAGKNYAGGAEQTTATGAAKENAAHTLTGTQNSTETGSSYDVIQGAGTNATSGKSGTTGTSTLATVLTTPDTTATPKTSSGVAGKGEEGGQVNVGNLKEGAGAEAGVNGAATYTESTPARSATGTLSSIGAFSSKKTPTTVTAAASQQSAAEAH